MRGGRSPLVIFQIFTNFRCAGNGFGDEWAAGLARRRPVFCRCADRAGLRGETVSAVVLVPVVAKQASAEVAWNALPALWQAAAATWLLVNLLAMLFRGWSEFSRLNTRRRRHGLVVQRRQAVHRLAWLTPPLGFWEPRRWC